MAESTGATETLADSGTQPPAGIVQSLADDDEQDQPDSISLDEAKKLRSEAYNLRRRLRRLEQEKEETTLAQLSEHEKALAKARAEGASEVLDKSYTLLRRAAVTGALVAAGINDDALSLAVLAPAFAGLEIDETGDVTGTKEAVERFRKAHPTFFIKPADVGTAGGGPRGAGPSVNTDPNELLRIAVRGR